MLGALVTFQFWASAGTSAVDSPPRTAPTIIKCFIATMLSWVYELFLYAASGYPVTGFAVNIKRDGHFSKPPFLLRPCQAHRGATRAHLTFATCVPNFRGMEIGRSDRRASRWSSLLLPVLLVSLSARAQRFVEITAEIELVAWRGDDTNGPSAKPRTISVVCLTGTNEWRMEEDWVIGGKTTWFFDGTNVYENR